MFYLATLRGRLEEDEESHGRVTEHLSVSDGKTFSEVAELPLGGVRIGELVTCYRDHRPEIAPTEVHLLRVGPGSDADGVATG